MDTLSRLKETRAAACGFATHRKVATSCGTQHGPTVRAVRIVAATSESASLGVPKLLVPSNSQGGLLASL